MDFLDPKKQRAHRKRLMINYVLITAVIMATATVLFYLVNGTSIKEGKIVQNGLLFVSSRPSASIYLNDQLTDKTNTRIFLPAGSYIMKLLRDGYREWQRSVTVEGRSVEHIDYPLLVPTNLLTSNVTSYKAAPGMATQSPDRRWLLVQRVDAFVNFDIYDLKDPKKIAIPSTKKEITLPAGILTSTTEAQSLKLSEWSNDNAHVLLKHTFGKQVEYILIDRENVNKSVNLTKQLQLTATARVVLRNGKYDRYFVFDAGKQTLGTAALASARVQPLLPHVLAFESYGESVVLYATTQGAAKGLVNFALYQGGQSYTIRSAPQDVDYMLEVTRYDGTWYAAVGSPKEGRVDVYKDPVSAIQKHESPIAKSILKVAHPTYIQASPNAQYIMAESGTSFALYDAENNRTHTYTLHHSLDKSQPHASWISAAQLTYVSNGIAVLFDYDGTNLQQLMPSSANYLPFFSQNYSHVYALNPLKVTARTPATIRHQVNFTDTALLIAADQ